MGFEVAVVEDVHVVLNHSNLPHEVAHFTFVEFGGGIHAEVFGIKAVAQGVLVAVRRTRSPFFGVVRWKRWGAQNSRGQ